MILELPFKFISWLLVWFPFISTFSKVKDGFIGLTSKFIVSKFSVNNTELSIDIKLLKELSFSTFISTPFPILFREVSFSSKKKVFKNPSDGIVAIILYFIKLAEGSKFFITVVFIGIVITVVFVISIWSAVSDSKIVRSYPSVLL